MGKQSTMAAEQLHFHFSHSCIGEGNGNPLQCSCLENPRDGGAWWAAVYGVAQSRTWLKWLSCLARLIFITEIPEWPLPWVIILYAFFFRRIWVLDMRPGKVRTLHIAHKFIKRKHRNGQCIYYQRPPWLTGKESAINAGDAGSTRLSIPALSCSSPSTMNVPP